MLQKVREASGAEFLDVYYVPVEAGVVAVVFGVIAVGEEENLDAVDGDGGRHGGGSGGGRVHAVVEGFGGGEGDVEVFG